MPALTLFYSPGACSLAPHVVLEEIGAPYAGVAVPVRDGAQRRPDYLAINPRGLVPALRIEDRVLTENPAILAWLATAFPEAGLQPAPGSLECGRAFEWLAWLSSSLHVAYAQLWRAERFLGAPVPPEAAVPLQAHGRARIAQCHAEIDAHLAGRRHAVGDAFGIVDANLLPFYRWGGRIGLDMRADYPHWTAHTERLAERAAVRRVIDREEISLWP